MTGINIIEACDILNETNRLMLADYLDDIGRSEEANILRAGPVIRDENGLFWPRSNKEYTAKYPLIWEEAHLHPTPAEWAEYVEQRECYGDCLEGEWYYADDYNGIIYSGSFGNDWAPGVNGYTFAALYGTREEYQAALAEWEAKPEYLETEDEDGPSEDDLVTYDHKHFYCNGKFAFVIDELDYDGELMWSAILLWMEKRGYSSNVWFISDHGNAHLMTRE